MEDDLFARLPVQATPGLSFHGRHAGKAERMVRAATNEKFRRGLTSRRSAIGSRLISGFAIVDLFRVCSDFVLGDISVVVLVETLKIHPANNQRCF